MTVVALLVIVLGVAVFRYASRRSDEQRIERVEAERRRRLDALRDARRRRQEIRCIGGCRPSATERWGGRAA